MTCDLIIAILWIVSSVCLGGWIFFPLLPVVLFGSYLSTKAIPFSLLLGMFVTQKKIRAINSLTPFPCPRMTKNLPSIAPALNPGVKITVCFFWKKQQRWKKGSDRSGAIYTDQWQKSQRISIWTDYLKDEWTLANPNHLPNYWKMLG